MPVARKSDGNRLTDSDSRRHFKMCRRIPRSSLAVEKVFRDFFHCRLAQVRNPKCVTWMSDGAVAVRSSRRRAEAFSRPCFTLRFC